MTSAKHTGKTARQTTAASTGPTAASGKGASLAPPPYGIDFVDRGRPGAMADAAQSLPSAAPVIQMAKWTREKVKRYQHHLRRRAAQRKISGKRKNTNKLLKRYMNARWKANPNWTPRLADAPISGHHVPPLAVSNNQGGGFEYGLRGSKQELKRRRLYFEGTEQERTQQHWMLHEAEGLQGINRSGTYSGNDEELANDMVLAHHGLERPDGTRLTAAVLNQNKRQRGKQARQRDLGRATKRVMEKQLSIDIDDVDSDDMSSSAESDEELWLTDSDEDS